MIALIATGLFVGCFAIYKGLTAKGNNKKRISIRERNRRLNRHIPDTHVTPYNEKRNRDKDTDRYI